MPFSAPTGFMVPPLHGVSSAVSCSGTLDQGSLFRFRVHSNYSVVVVIWTFVVRVTYMRHVIGVRYCKAWDIHPVLKNVFFFQILVLSYERFISLPFFSHLLHLFKLRRWFFIRMSLDPRAFWLYSRLDFNRTFLCTIIQGRDATRASHTSRL